MVLALLSSRKSKSATESPLTACRTCMRVNAIIELSVPISGVKPGLGPISHGDDSWDCVAVAREGQAEALAAKAAPNFRKLRRLDRHSSGKCMDMTTSARVQGKNRNYKTIEEVSRSVKGSRASRIRPKPGGRAA